MISEQFYQSLPDDLKEIVLEADTIAHQATMETVDSIITNGIQTLKDNGVEIYEPTEEELKEWHDAYVDNTLALAKKEMGEETVNDFLTAVNEYCR